MGFGSIFLSGEVFLVKMHAQLENPLSGKHANDASYDTNRRS